MKEDEKILLSQIRECFGRVAYSHKTHEKQADIFIFRNNLFKWIQICLSVVTTGTLFPTLLEICPEAKFWLTLISAILVTILAGINLYLKNFNYDSKAQQHHDTAVQLWNIRESYLSLITDLTIDTFTDVDQIRKNRDILQKQLSDIYKNAPRTTEKAYLKAQKALKLNEDLTFSSKEIDMLLPTELRLNEEDNQR